MLDLKDGYWQVILAEESVLLTHHLEDTGLPECRLVLKSASEVFQKKNEEAFSGIPGIHIGLMT